MGSGDPFKRRLGNPDEAEKTDHSSTVRDVSRAEKPDGMGSSSGRHSRNPTEAAKTHRARTASTVGRADVLKSNRVQYESSLKAIRQGQRSLVHSSSSVKVTASSSFSKIPAKCYEPTKYKNSGCC